VFFSEHSVDMQFTDMLSLFPDLACVILMSSFVYS